MKSSSPYRLIVLIGLCLIFACEDVTIFAEPERPQAQEVEVAETVGVCMIDADCPQWLCVGSSCQEGVCVPERFRQPALSLEPIFLEDTVVSISMDKDRLIALAGEVKSMAMMSEEDSEQSTRLTQVPLSLGIGKEILQWELTAPYPEADSTQAQVKEYEEATWQKKNPWTPNLTKVINTVSLDPDEPNTTNEVALDLRALSLQNGRVWLHAGEQVKDLWWGNYGQTSAQGKFFGLASPIQDLIVDEDEVWVSIFDKGLERLALTVTPTEDDDEDASQQANARFNTPGRALSAQAGRSFVVVADGYAGLSLFNKRAGSSLETLNPARRLVTPPQELSSAGRTVHLDLVEDRIITAEYGLGFSLVRVNTEGGLQHELTMALDGIVRWVKWVDPYTALVWVDGRGIVALDLLTKDQIPVIIAEETLPNMETETTTSETEVEAAIWTASGSRFALLTPQGSLYHGGLSCAARDE